MSADAVFGALADPTRRRIVELLAGGGQATPTTLAAGLPITRQAVAKHLDALGAAGLVEHDRVGRETRYRLTPQPLSDAAGWIASVGAEWDARLERLARLLEAGAAGRSREAGSRESSRHRGSGRPAEL